MKSPQYMDSHLRLHRYGYRNPQMFVSGNTASAEHAPNTFPLIPHRWDAHLGYSICLLINNAKHLVTHTHIISYDFVFLVLAVPVSALTAAQAAAVQQQQAMAAAANYRYMTLPSHQQVTNHPQVISTEYVYTSGGPMSNHIVTSQPLVPGSHAQPLIYTTTATSQQQQQIQQTYDQCPAICSLFAIFCCPITCWCSLPALAYSLCAYTDFRANDMHAYRSKSDVARRCVIVACIIGLILCIIWAILTFLYYGEMLLLLGDIIKAVQRHLWPGN